MAAIRWVVGALATSLLASAAKAQKRASAVDTGNTAWVLTSTARVLFTTIPGLSLLYAGLMRTKNVLSVLMQCFVLTCLMTLLWLFYGYSLAFDTAGMQAGITTFHSFIGSLDKAFLAGVTVHSTRGTIPEVLFFAFQLSHRHPGADHRRLRGAAQVLRDAAVHGGLAHFRLPPRAAGEPPSTSDPCSSAR